MQCHELAQYVVAVQIGKNCENGKRAKYAVAVEIGKTERTKSVQKY